MTTIPSKRPDSRANSYELWSMLFVVPLVFVAFLFACFSSTFFETDSTASGVSPTDVGMTWVYAVTTLLCFLGTGVWSYSRWQPSKWKPEIQAVNAGDHPDLNRERSFGLAALVLSVVCAVGTLAVTLVLTLAGG